MDQQWLQLQVEADVLCEFAKDKIPRLVKLALLLLNIRPPCAGLEHVFSASGIYHNAQGIDLDTGKFLRWFM